MEGLSSHRASFAISLLALFTCHLHVLGDCLKLVETEKVEDLLGWSSVCSGKFPVEREILPKWKASLVVLVTHFSHVFVFVSGAIPWWVASLARELRKYQLEMVVVLWVL